MIHNYINLSCWSECNKIADKFDKDKCNNYYCDSIYFYLLIKMICGPIDLNPGSTEKGNAINNLDKSHSLFIFSKHTDIAKNQLICSFLNNEDEIKRYASEIVKFIRKQNLKIEFIYLGISSPKQNLLAFFIKEFLNDCNIFCIGAVLDDMILNNNRKYPKGFEWLFRLLENPKRALLKFKKYLIETFTILFIKKKKFQKFYKDYLVKS